MHPRDVRQLSLSASKSRQPVRGIGHAGRNKMYVITLPVETHHNFGIEIHPFTQRFHALRQLQLLAQSVVDAKAAHTLSFNWSESVSIHTQMW